MKAPGGVESFNGIDKPEFAERTELFHGLERP
jgi:hypothetical protein